MSQDGRNEVHDFRLAVEQAIKTTLVVGSASVGQNLQFGSGGFSWVTPASVSFDDLAPSGSGSPGMLTTDGATWSYVSYATARTSLGLVIGTDVATPQNERTAEQFWDCDGAVGDWFNTTSGAGAAATVFTTDHIGGALHVCGEWGIGTGTTATGYGAFYKQPCIGFGDGTAYEFECRATNGALSTAGEEFQMTVGFGDAFNTTGQPVDCACFIYRRGIELVDFWVCITRSNSTETKTVTAVAPAGYSAMTIFKVAVNSTGTSVVFSINGSVVATHTTDIPTGASRLTGLGLKLEKTNGTTARYAYVDWFRLKKARTAAR